MTPAWWWSWLLLVVGVTGQVLAGRHMWQGWAIGLASEGLWLAYAITTRQWGFIPFAVIYAVVYARNARAWRNA